MALLVFLTPTLLPERERGFLVLQCGIHCGGHAPRGTIAIVAEYRRLGIAPPCIVCIVVQTTDTVGGGGHMGPPGNAAFIAGEHAPRGTITIVAEYRRLGIAPPCIVCIAIQTMNTVGGGEPMCPPGNEDHGWGGPIRSAMRHSLRANTRRVAP